MDPKLTLESSYYNIYCTQVNLLLTKTSRVQLVNFSVQKEIENYKINKIAKKKIIILENLLKLR